MEVNKTKHADLMLLGNKELYNKLVNKNEKSIIMKNDFIKYKKEIKTKINELFTYYSDPSNNCLFINNNNEDYKYLTSFASICSIVSLFLIFLIVFESLLIIYSAGFTLVL